MARSRENGSFDLAAAVTRSLLGWGVVAGIFYLLVGATHGLLRDGFSFADHVLSLLMLGDFGWIQATNLILTGLMVVAAAIGFGRAMKPGKGAKVVGTLLTLYGLALVGSGIFPPDAVDGFPDPSSTAQATTRGILHLAFGGMGFFALGTAAFFAARWHEARGDLSGARRSRLCAAVVLLGFLGGASLAANTAGIALIWVAVVTGWVWLAITARHLYHTVPHPDLHRRKAAVVGGPKSARHTS